ncbi:hypothetical protein HDU96_008701 [Phlyctochytrium bullatum]|nr:hypothetical protein HDU96_008701 [Phlyctochytrium bullatum]
MVKKLLELGADPHYPESKSPLCFAAKSGSLEVVDTLLAYGAKVRYERVKDTPLHLAAAEGHVDIIHRLIAQGADVHDKIKGETPQSNSTRAGGRSASTFKSRKETVLESHVKEDENTTDTFYGACTQLLVETLVELGADVNAQGKNGRTAISRITDEDGEMIEVARILLEAGARVPERYDDNEWSQKFVDFFAEWKSKIDIA